MSRRVKLYYDVLSPFSWIAFEVLHRYRLKWDLELQLCPFLLGVVVQLSGNSSPALIQLKGMYMMKDVARLAQYYQIPIKFPRDVVELMFTKGSMNAQRLLVAANADLPGKIEHISRELWMRTWSRDEDITEEASLIQVCVKAGLDEQTTKKLLARSQDQDIKDKLKANSQEAFELGAFGAPFIVVYKEEKPEVFFGSDRFNIIAHILGVKWEGPLVNTSKL